MLRIKWQLRMRHWNNCTTVSCVRVFVGGVALTFSREHTSLYLKRLIALINRDKMPYKYKYARTCVRLQSSIVQYKDSPFMTYYQWKHSFSCYATDRWIMRASLTRTYDILLRQTSACKLGIKSSAAMYW